MCRGKQEGNRRCPGCVGPEAMVKHNERRRNNRLIRRHAAQWAQEQGLESEAARLRAANPKDVKEWLHAQETNPEHFIEGIPEDHQDPGGDPATGAGPAVIHRPAAPAAPAGRGAAPRSVGRPPPGGGSSAHPRRHREKWQSEPWCTPGLADQITAAQGLQGGHRDERSLLDGTPDRIAPLPRTVARSGAPRAGTNETVRIELDNGVTGYFKPFSGERRDLATGFGQDSHQQGVHEAAAWRLASQMGPPWSEIVPPVVVRNVRGEMGSFALERPGRTGNYDLESLGEWREAAFFDCLIGQQDRHPANYLAAGDRITLIDHGYSFACPGDVQNWSHISGTRLRNDPALSYHERQVLQRLTSSPDLLGLEKILQPARAAALRDRADRMLSTGRLADDY